MMKDEAVRRATLHALRLTIESIYRDEVEIARLRKRKTLVEFGFVEPQESEPKR